MLLSTSSLYPQIPSTVTSSAPTQLLAWLKVFADLKWHRSMSITQVKSCLKRPRDLSSGTTSLCFCSIGHLSPSPFFHACLEPTYKGSYHQLSPLSTEMLKILTPVPVLYTAVLAIISSTTGRTGKQQGKRIGNEDPYLPEKRTTITTFPARFSASERPKSWFGGKKKYPRSQRLKLAMYIAGQPQSAAKPHQQSLLISC